VNLLPQHFLQISNACAALALRQLGSASGPPAAPLAAATRGRNQPHAAADANMCLLLPTQRFRRTSQRRIHTHTFLIARARCRCLLDRPRPRQLLPLHPTIILPLHMQPQQQPHPPPHHPPPHQRRRHQPPLPPHPLPSRRPWSLFSCRCRHWRLLRAASAAISR